MEAQTELESLQNAADIFNGTVHEVYQEDKRRTTKKFYLTVGFNQYGKSQSISPSSLDYDQMNHFIFGYITAIKVLTGKN